MEYPAGRGCPAIHAMGGDERPAVSQTDPDYADGKQAIDAKNWARAVESLNKEKIAAYKSNAK